ncbi:MAG: hypothetical protein HYX69_21010 [Planctomycetia bacterium]|nr:hypothetical protein [Planctomycetia bacterium]
MPYPHVIRLRGPWDFEVLSRDASVGCSASTGVVEGAHRNPVLAEHPTSAGGSQPEEPVLAEHPTKGRVQLPADWGETLGADFRGRVRYRRHFNRPTGLEPHERVWLVADGVDAAGSFSLNGQPLGLIDGYAVPATSDVTDRLQPSNVVEVDVVLPPDAALRGAARREPRPPVSTSARGSAGASPSLTPNPQPLTSAPTPIIRPGRERLAGGPIGEVRLEIRALWHVDRLAVYWQPGDPPLLHVSGLVGGPATGEPLMLIASGCQRELMCEPVAAGTSFDFATTAHDWPEWPDPDAEPVLTPVEVRLVAGASAVWQTMRETAPPSAHAAAEWPARVAAFLRHPARPWLDYSEADSPELTAALHRASGGMIGSRGILPDAVYKAFDLANVAVVQQVPAAWAAAVCPRLAHHPSIVAWAAPAAESLAAAGSLDRLAFGRQWLAFGE